MSGFTVEVEAYGWVVCKDGEAVTKAVSNKWRAGEKRDALEHAARMKERNCLRCATPFMSEGAHHRMCNGCRQSVRTMFEGAV
ncbi:hypothetical protein M3P21_18810 [Ruegeria sp. 2012CJ41-6]|uniref:Uncharacterized protein n=1 Tax=Ruegeria spongiae TaxID=2942209 RepID=A0ABT0Q6Z1_9RHOB|nr:hypothetical protein [Ruegeria spongiae]MCL6285585.1 hypothetical protein [Ruegeria spongiae]